MRQALRPSVHANAKGTGIRRDISTPFKKISAYTLRRIADDKPTCRYKPACDLRKLRRGAALMSGLSLVPGERRGWRLLQIRFGFSEIHAFDQAVCDGIE